MKYTYKAATFDEKDEELAWYVRWSESEQEFKFCAVHPVGRLDRAQGNLEAQEVPTELRKQCIFLCGPWVFWKGKPWKWGD